MTIYVDDSISLELLDDKHAEATFKLIDANRNYLKEWLPWVGNMQTINNFKTYISNSKKQSEAATDFGYAILFNNNISGRIGIHYIDQKNKTASLGYWLGENFAGRGIITKSCKAKINYAFTALNLNRIEIKCATKNYKSKAIDQRLNFKQEGILKEAELVNGKFINLYLFAMLKSEWQIC